MKDLIISPAAASDLTRIWYYTLEMWGRTQADRYVGDISATFEDVAAGRVVPKSAAVVRAGYVKVNVGRHVVFLKEFPERIEVVRVLHERMDVGRL